MKLAGDVVVGFTYSQEARYLILSKSPPSTIIYNTSQLRPISVIGASTTEKDDNLAIDPFRCPLIERNPPFRDACFSLSPLMALAALGCLTIMTTDFAWEFYWSSIMVRNGHLGSVV